MCDMDSGSDFDVSSDIDSDISSDFDSDTNSEYSFEGLDLPDDTNCEFTDVEGEVIVTESVDDVEFLDTLEEITDDSSIEVLETETTTELYSLDDIEEVDTMMNITEREDGDLCEDIESSISELSGEDMETFIENTNDVEQLYELRDSLVNGDVSEVTIPDSLEGLDDPTIESVNEESTETVLEQLTLDDLSDETSYIEPEVVVTENEIQELIENETDVERLGALRDSLLSGEIAVETDETADEESPKVLTREITPEIIESRERDTEEILNNYQDNLREYGVGEEQKINIEYESLDCGDTSSNIYYQPTDWEEVANSLTIGQTEQLNEEISNGFDIKPEVEQTDSELQETSINYDEIYEGIQQEALEESFADIQIDADPERLDNSLENFNASTWENLTLDEQKGSMENLADYVVDVIGFQNPPNIEYYSNTQEGDFGENLSIG